jgi:hypothetical protein
MSMLAWFRAQSSRIAFVAMASLVALGMSAVSPHVDDCHDAACLGLVVEHDASAHRFVAPVSVTDAAHLHCLVCHWTRSFRPPITTKFSTGPNVLVRTMVPLDTIFVARNAQIAQPPLRSPPLSPLTA